MRRIIYREDGGVSIITPAPKSKLDDETKTEWLKRVFNKATPRGAAYEDVADSKIPKDREFRNAWAGQKGKELSIDPIKKQEIIDAKSIS